MELKKMKLAFASEESAKDFVKNIGLENVQIATAREIEVSPKDVLQEMSYLRSYMDSEFRYYSNRIGELSKRIYEHESGHLPKLTPGQLEKLLKAVGADSDYEVKKRTIYASDGKSESVGYY